MASTMFGCRSRVSFPEACLRILLEVFVELVVANTAMMVSLGMVSSDGTDVSLYPSVMVDGLLFVIVLLRVLKEWGDRASLVERLPLFLNNPRRAMDPFRCPYIRANPELQRKAAQQDAVEGHSRYNALENAETRLTSEPPNVHHKQLTTKIRGLQLDIFHHFSDLVKMDLNQHSTLADRFTDEFGVLLHGQKEEGSRLKALDGIGMHPMHQEELFPVHLTDAGPLNN